METRQMIEVTAVKLFFSNTWAWIKKHWKLVTAGVVGLVLFVFHKDKLEQMKDVIVVKDESSKEQIEKIEETNKQEREERDKIIVDHVELIQDIEAKFRENKKRITKKRKEEIKKIVEEVGDDPSELAKRISDQYGFVYINSGEE
jgi:hypothetical protein